MSRRVRVGGDRLLFPSFFKAAIESPPPTITLTPFCFASLSELHIELVPSENNSFSNTPIGPFQKIVLLKKISLQNFSIDFFPISSPIQSSSILFESKENKELIRAIQFILGYKTKKPELFKLALLHKSIKSDESNERLEFLGDTILNSIISEYLFEKFPNEKEGLLTRMRSHLVKGETLSKKANKIG